MKSIPVVLILLTAVLHGEDEKPMVVESDEAIRIEVGERPVLVYNKSHRVPPDGIEAVYGRSGHIHPVYSPSGKIVTDEFPPDHAHQSGIFLAWTRTEFQDRHVDFWNLKDKLGYVEHRKVLTVGEGAGNPGFSVQLAHVDLTSGTPIDVLYETWNVQLVEVSETYTVFDIESTQVCAGNDPLKVMKYRYGGMAIRTTSQWLGEPDAANAPIVLTDKGRDRITGDQEKANWLMMSGKIDEESCSVISFSHPDNMRAPQRVRIHPEMPYFVWSPGNRKAFTIKPGKPYHSRYRFIITSGAPEKTWIEEQFSRYAD